MDRDGAGGGKYLWAYANRSVIQSDLYALGLDGSYFEHYQYILLSWCAILCFWVTRSHQINSYRLCLPLTWLFLFIDDSFSLHDRTGGDFINNILTQYINDPPFLRTKDIAEILFWVAAFLIFACISLVEYSLTNSSWHKVYHYQLDILLLLAIFGIGIDVIGANIEKIINIYDLPGSIALRIFYSLDEVGEISTIAAAAGTFYYILCAMNKQKTIR